MLRKIGAAARRADGMLAASNAAAELNLEPATEAATATATATAAAAEVVVVGRGWDSESAALQLATDNCRAEVRTRLCDDIDTPGAVAVTYGSLQSS